MTVKASARSALILAAGFLVGFAAPLPATAAGAESAAASSPESATSGKSVKQGSRDLKKRYSHRKSTHAAAKSDENKKAEEQQVADAGGSLPPGMPAWLANANAQMISADSSPEGANDTAKAMSAAMSEKATTVLQAAADKPADAEAPADANVVASDQLNDVDRALHPSQTDAAQTVAMASAKPASDAQAATSDSSTLDKTSLIGKIFIAFGALLTVASAARMFMA